ncbi:MAG: VWA domain-containing protein [Armatimonadota bacterium]|nr:VWA domain-containing protein [Armatimonadota bacterium]MDR7550960.1 VWA domain-containing protein [Armatimonadota bacterium]
MEFHWPLMLLALLLVPLLAGAYQLALRRQRRIAERFAESRLFEQLVVRPPAWQRTLPLACYLAAVAVLAVAMARPVAALPLPVNQAAAIVAIDTSKSMIATDVAPSRVEAAKAAARAFAGLVPRSTKIGLVTFSEYGTLLLAPTTDRAAFAESLERIQLQSATSVGGGILEAVRVLPGREAAFRERLDRLMRRETGPPLTPNPLEPRPRPEDLVPASVILFSDGVNNFGPDPYEAAQLARDAKVRIFTVGLGTPGGTVMRIDGQLVLVPFDPAGLERIAQLSGGRHFASASDEDLRQISRQLGRIIGWEWTRTEVSFLLLAVAGVFVAAGGAMSMTWFRRLP